MGTHFSRGGKYCYDLYSELIDLVEVAPLSSPSLQKHTHPPSLAVAASRCGDTSLQQALLGL